MSIKDKYVVKEINKKETHYFIKFKHYAKRIPPIIYSYGLFLDDDLVGVCTYGSPCRLLNNLYENIKTIELNRLFTIDNLEKNVLSYFVSQTFKLLPKPLCIVSYADGNNNHHGYIYQSTNFVFTGLSDNESNYYLNNKLTHRRSIFSKYGTGSIPKLKERGIDIYKVKQKGKYRYFNFLGSKKDKKFMLNNLKFKVYPYPKGENINYET